jgi:GxxExxY protein
MDIVVGRQVIVELKSVEALLPVHEAQLLTCDYLGFIWVFCSTSTHRF